MSFEISVSENFFNLISNLKGQSKTFININREHTEMEREIQINWTNRV